MTSKSDFFLREFTKELILNTKILFPERFQLERSTSFIPQINAEEPSKPNIAVGNVNVLQATRSTTSNLVPSVNIAATRANVLKSSPSLAVNTSNIGFIPVGNAFNLTKINDLVRDNSINSIESPGVGRPILIRKMQGGPSVVTKVVLVREDINQILNSFSIQARIPRIGGIFRAIVGNLLITAVDSEFNGGPKFVISKVAWDFSLFIKY